MFMFSFKANLEKKEHQFSFGTNISCNLKTHPYGRSWSHYAMLANATLVYGEIGL